MSADVVAPVKSILKTIDSGIKLGKRVARSAKNAPPIQAQEISYSAQNLQKSLGENSRSISEAYAQTVEICGQPFIRGLEEDRAIQSRLKDLRIALIDQIDSCQDFDEEPDLFEPSAFTSVQQAAQKCSDECVSIFGRLRDQHFQACLQTIRAGHEGQIGQKMEERNSTISARPAEPPSQLSSPPRVPSSPSTHIGHLHMHKPSSSAPVKPKNPWAIDNPSQFDLGPLTQRPAPPREVSTRRRPSRGANEISIAPGDLYPDEQPTRLIPEEVVRSRLNTNEEFLARRRQSRIMFQNEIRGSIASIEEHRASEVFNDKMPSDLAASSSTPVMPYSSNTYSSNTASSSSSNPGGTYSSSPNTTYSSSPVGERISRASSSGYDSLMTRQRSQGQFSSGTRSSATSSMIHDRQTRRESQDPVSPLKTLPMGSPSGELPAHEKSENLGTLSATLHVPGYGVGIESGLEVVTQIDYGNEKMLVEDEHPFTRNTPTASMKSIDYPIRVDTSFYKFGGFCEGAKAMIKGETGFKVVKRPSGHYSATVSARCIKCAYEVGWNDVEKDRLLLRDGIYGNSGIRWRQKFISKCHVKTNSIEEPYYACIFCIEEHKTVEEHDATIFFSVGQLFRHLAKHPRPLPNVYGVTTIYGYQPPEVLDFDLHFTTTEPRPTQYSLGEIASKVATRASAQATSTHNPKTSGRNARDPDGNETLHFAAGARIVGITFPERWSGQCTLTAIARWDFKPKEAKDGGWLKFSRGDKITCVGLDFPNYLERHAEGTRRTIKTKVSTKDDYCAWKHIVIDEDEISGGSNPCNFYAFDKWVELQKMGGLLDYFKRGEYKNLVDFVNALERFEGRKRKATSGGPTITYNVSKD
ncbi:hypothetical protein G7Y89_g10153 [Cudoniella acicularis]|uniref:Uncharacterized protein n=1 Tax=Cudoniella acicularis TaxID=354080 RepID=A0A8H4RG17_9HELO|nr:hypothetical protein G7Y89_g10153 [Cudoniella acicularis]